MAIVKRRSGVGPSTHEPRYRMAVLWLIAILSTLDLAGAAYLRVLWNERHAVRAGVAGPQWVPTPSSDSARASTERRVTVAR